MTPVLMLVAISFMASANIARAQSSGSSVARMKPPMSAAIEPPARVNVQSGDGTELRVTIMKIDPARAHLDIVYVPEEGRIGSGRGKALALRDLAVAERDAKLMVRSRAWVNGGFSAYSVDLPLGLLISGGRLVSRLNEAKSESVGGCDTSAWPLKWSGVLCQASTNGKWSIVRTTEYVEGACKQALQAGPMLVDMGKNSICASESQEKKTYDRSVVCTTADGTLLFVLAENTHLYPLAQWLAGTAAQSGLGCSQALNLSGDASAGIAVWNRNQRDPSVFGQASFPLASAIVVREK